MKRWLVVFTGLSLLLLIVLPACGGGGGEKTLTTSPTITAVPTATPTAIPMVTATATPTPTRSVSSAETTPTRRESSAEETFIIEVSDPIQDVTGFWSVTIGVTCNYHHQLVDYTPEPVYGGSIEVSFPGISNVSNIKQYTTDMEKGITLIPPGGELSTNYGEGATTKIKAAYPVLVARKETWTFPGKRSMSFKFLPEKRGTFTFYVKAKGLIDIENRLYAVYSPAAGTKDQQMEYVEEHTFTASTYVPVEVSYDEFHTASVSNGGLVSKTVEVIPGDSVAVTLWSNRTTGYSWSESATISAPGVLQQTNHNYVAPQTGLMGAAGKEVWTFIASKAGTCEVSMSYSQPWEGGQKNTYGFSLTVTVK